MPGTYLDNKPKSFKNLNDKRSISIWAVSPHFQIGSPIELEKKEKQTFLADLISFLLSNCLDPSLRTKSVAGRASWVTCSAGTRARRSTSQYIPTKFETKWSLISVVIEFVNSLCLQVANDKSGLNKNIYLLKTETATFFYLIIHIFNRCNPPEPRWQPRPWTWSRSRHLVDFTVLCGYLLMVLSHVPST